MRVFTAKDHEELMSLLLPCEIKRIKWGIIGTDYITIGVE